jgi:anti-sigma B factor antagonist
MREQEVRSDVVLTTERTGARAVVRISGELDAFSAPSLESEVGRLLDDNVSDLVFDLAATGFLDSSGLRAILATQRAVAGLDGRLALRAPSTSVRRLLDIAGLSDQFIIET